MRILIFGASYGSLLSTKLLMAGHDTTLICYSDPAKLINAEGTVVRIKLRDEDEHRSFSSNDFPGNVDACPPDDVKSLDGYDMVALAMQEPQYSDGAVRGLLGRVAESGKPCLSIMNMPPLPYLRRVPALAEMDFSGCYDDIGVWEGLDPENVTLCSPDPQAFMPPEEKDNLLHVGLPTNFKAADFSKPEHSRILKQLADDIAAVKIDGKDIPVKLRVHDSLFVPMAKWSMLLTGNYRCIRDSDVQSIHDAVHSSIEESQAMYHWVDELARKLGADAADQVPFEKYAAAAKSLLKPSSAARAIDAGASRIERVDRLVKTIGGSLGMNNDVVDKIVSTVDARLAANGA